MTHYTRPGNKNVRMICCENTYLEELAVGRNITKQSDAEQSL